MKEHYRSNLQIHFCSSDEFLSIMGDSYTNMDGALLYHPNILCGMDADTCANVIRELYY